MTPAAPRMNAAYEPRPDLEADPVKVGDTPEDIPDAVELAEGAIGDPVGPDPAPAPEVALANPEEPAMVVLSTVSKDIWLCEITVDAPINSGAISTVIGSRGNRRVRRSAGSRRRTRCI